MLKRSAPLPGADQFNAVIFEQLTNVIADVAEGPVELFGQIAWARSF
jgi:hypothetical protein